MTGIILREDRPDDFDFIAARQAMLYACDYDWDGTYEALAAKILKAYAAKRDPSRERGWVAEIDGEMVGSVFVMREDETTARLRLLHVEKAAQGQGLGRKLVRQCTEFAKAAGYQRMVLWTQSTLLPARKLYADEGYRLIKSEPHHSFGHDLVGETWELSLRS
ncbi:GNAT family N-acetyltransferase [Aestuariivirga litoralis]|uniref:GNAT family N-acetyltransferase n=1 Tax=Aestuariivirga litoralis TaxID=2650924 RepID=UPI0018C676D1|nr:GNAT family N-acetyltransferase [Aestuariivirga litoralis]